MERPDDAIECQFTLKKSETMSLSREEAGRAAKAHQELPQSPTERPLDLKRVMELLLRIRTKQWLPCNWATVDYEGKKYRMNGQHSSRAILDALEENVLGERVVIHLDHYGATTAAGMAQLFRQFDARFSGRSKQDVAGAYKGVIHALDGVNRDKAKLGIEGIAYYERVIERLPVPSGDNLYELFFRDQYHSFLRWLDGILSIKTPELKRVPIVATMYGTYLQSVDGATEFWSAVATGDLNDDTDPRFVLAQDLVRIKEAKGEPPRPPAEFYAKCGKAWNAFRSGDKVKTLSVNTKKGLPALAA